MNISPAARPLPARPAANAAPLPADRAKMTTLQRHVAFFDRNNDGKITVAETREGLKSLGLGSVGAYFGALFINLGLASKTASGSKTVIDVKTISQSMHDSDSGVIDANGQFDPAAFDAMFAKYDANHDGALSGSEIATMQKARAASKKGQVGSKAEFGLLMKLAADGKAVENGKEVPTLSRARLQALYDGTLFDTLAAARKAK